MASCTTSDEVFEGLNLAEQATQENAINFGTYMGESKQTRAGTQGLITTDQLKTGTHAADGFGVFAYYTGSDTYQDATSYAVKTDGSTGQSALAPNFMYNQQVKWNSSLTGYISQWEYTPLKYWPNEVQNGAVDDQTSPAATTTNGNGGHLSFFAYAPYVSSASGSEGITVMTANSDESDPILTYVVPASGANAVDLLWGTLGSASENVVGGANSGVAYLADGTNYQQSILPSYTMNADLTKQKTDGKVDFAFKHALAKVGGSGTGMQIVLDLDDQKGALTGGTKADGTKVTVKSITIAAKAKSAVSGTDVYYQTNMTGNFNLATGRWGITSSTGTAASAATTTYVINQSGTGTNVAGTLTTSIAEPASAPAKTEDGFDGLPVGVLASSATNVFSAEAAPLVFIPGSYPELTVTVDYIVRTLDTNLANKYSEVEQAITRTITFGSAVELNKRYSLVIHLGLTSVKFDASVSDWDEDGGSATTIYLPINVD